MQKIQFNINKFIYFLGLIFLLNCSETHVQSNNKYEEAYDNEIWNPIIKLSRKDKKLVQASSDKLYKNTNQMALLTGNVEVDFYNQDGHHSSVLQSDTARIDEKNNNLYASGNVYVVSDSGYTLSTSELIWDNRYEMIIAEDSVMFTHPGGDTLFGIGFESDIDLERYKIYKPFGIFRKGI